MSVDEIWESPWSVETGSVAGGPGCLPAGPSFLSHTGGCRFVCQGGAASTSPDRLQSSG